MAMTKQFTKTQWNNDREPAITAEQLNRMEKGIDVNDTRIVELDKAVTANKNAGDKSLEEVNKTLQKHTEDITAVNNELTSQGKAIGELADKKITKFYASSQGDSTLNDSDNGKMQDMMLYGRSEQKQYSGKNLLNPTLQTATQNGVTCTANGDGTYTLNGTATNVAFFEVTKMTNLKLKKVLGCPKGGNQDTYKLYVLDTKNYRTGFDDFGNGAIVSANVNNDLEFSIRLRVAKDATVNNVVFKPMITTDTSATYDDYEPYTGGIPSPNPDYPQEIKSVVEPVVKVTNKDETESQSVPLTGITLNAIPVSSGGNVTIDGQQYISDYVDVERGKIVRMVKMVVLDASENWGKETSITNYSVFTSPTALTNIKQDDDIANYCCNQFRTIPVKDRYSLNTLFINKRFLVIITMDRKNTLDDFKEVLSSNIEVYYSLATPTEESLSEELAEKLKALQTYYSQTNLFITSNQLDGYAIFNYPISLANGWNYVKQQIGDTRDYIYDMDLQMAHAYVNSEYAVALTELEV